MTKKFLTIEEQIELMLENGVLTNRLQAVLFLYLKQNGLTSGGSHGLALAKDLAAFVGKHVHVDVDRE
jgi:hypothetical protein